MKTVDFQVRDNQLISIFDAMLHDITKSVHGNGDSFELTVTTLASLNTYNTYMFSMNEMEGNFSMSDDTLGKITLRDTKVHKKLEFTDKKAQLIYARGQDVVGKHSEVIYSTTKESIYNITINGEELSAPFDLNELYLTLTGIDLNVEAEEIEVMDVLTNWWDAFEDISKKTGGA